MLAVFIVSSSTMETGSQGGGFCIALKAIILQIQRSNSIDNHDLPSTSRSHPRTTSIVYIVL